MTIHPTAIIDATATIHPSVKMGPYCIIGEHVTIGAQTVLHPMSSLASLPVSVSVTRFFNSLASAKTAKISNTKARRRGCEIGDDNRIREACSIHRGTVQDKGITRVGSRNLFMVNTHIAHDCVIGNDNIVANNVGIAGHVRIGNHVIVGGNSGIHQFCSIDDYSLIGGASLILKDVAAFNMVSGNPAKSHGLNIEGMRRKRLVKADHRLSATSLSGDFPFRTDQGRSHCRGERAAITPRTFGTITIDSLIHSERGLVR